MKSNTVETINKLGNAGYLITKTGKILLIVSAVVCFVGALIMCFVPKDLIRIELESVNSAVIIIDDEAEQFSFIDLDIADGFIEIGDNRYQLVINDENMPLSEKNTVYISNIKWILFATALFCIAAYVSFYFANKLCAYFRNCETPFSDDISKGILNFAWSLIPISLISSVIETFTESVLFGNFDILIQADLVTVLLILSVFMLSYIFKYGTKLQTESDETL